MLSLATPVFAYVMSSTSYRMERDSINFGGGLSTSTSYGDESTLGEVGTGSSTSTSYVIQAGYQQMDGSWVSLSVPATASLAPSINIFTGGIASTSVDFSVSTNNGAGYTLQMKSNTNPALKGATFDFYDYTLDSSAPDYAWSVSSTDAEFGFTPEGNDIVARYKDNGASCDQAGGSNNPDTCWDKASTTYMTIAQSAAPNYPATAVTAVKFKAEAGVDSAITVGSYTAEMIVTAYTN